jgi:hypothetical protein
MKAKLLPSSIRMKFIPCSSRLGLALALTLMASLALHAQNPAQETLQQKVGLPTTVTGQNIPESTSDQDLGTIGVVQKFPQPDMFSVSTSQQFFYTDNVFFTQHNPLGSAGYLGTYTGSYVPYSTRDWTPRIGLQYNMVRYDTVPAGDFNNENLALSSQYVFSRDRTWTWTAAVDLSRFTDPHDNGNEFYQEVVYDNQITHVNRLFKDVPLFVAEAYDLAYHQASPADYDRLDNSFSFSVTYSPISSVSIEAFVRPEARIYFTNTSYQTDRDDFNLSEGLDVTWTPWEYVSLSADFTNTNDYSNAAGQSYNETSPGVALTGVFKF